jgi:peptidoglycan/LPS O-acetylase OafA/YrhL
MGPQLKKEWGDAFLVLGLLFADPAFSAINDAPFKNAFMLLLFGGIGVSLAIWTVRNRPDAAAYLAPPVLAGLAYVFTGPNHGIENLFFAVTMGVALVLVGACCGYFGEGSPILRRTARLGFYSGLILSPIGEWVGGKSFLAGLVDGPAFWGLCVALPLYCGWRLGQRRERGGHDARLGSADFYRQAGISDER